MSKSLAIAILITFGLMLAWHPAVAGEWGAGIALATQQPPQNGVKRDNIGTPYITYQGKRLKVDLAGVSYALYETETFAVSILGEFRFDGYKPGDSEALDGMASRKSSVDAGLRLSRSTDWGSLYLEVVGDVAGTHGSIEARAAYQRPFIAGRWLLLPSIGVSWQDKTLVTYYYGVRADEANASRPSYAGQDAVNYFAEVSAGYSLSDRVELSAGIKYTRLGESISNSPIVERSRQTTIVTALLYKF